MLTMLTLAALAVALLCPDTTVGALVRRLLVELPARKLAALTPARVTFAVLVAAAIMVAVTTAKATGMIVVAQTIPDGLAWFATFDMASYLDALALVWLVAANVRFRAAFRALRLAAERARRWTWRIVGALAGRLAARQRSPHTRPTKSTTRNSDDGEWPALAFQAA